MFSRPYQPSATSLKMTMSAFCYRILSALHFGWRGPSYFDIIFNSTHTQFIIEKFDNFILVRLFKIETSARHHSWDTLNIIKVGGIRGNRYNETQVSSDQARGNIWSIPKYFGGAALGGDHDRNVVQTWAWTWLFALIALSGVWATARNIPKMSNYIPRSSPI